jgi:hypothetical protein
MTVHYANSSTPISGELIHYVRQYYRAALRERIRKHPDPSVLCARVVSRDRATLAEMREFEAPSAIPAYILAVTAVEAFLNEAFLSDFFTGLPGLSAMPQMSEATRARLERLPAETKLVVLPHCAFGKSLNRDEQTYQDMRRLIRLRNELVHYKMGVRAPQVLRKILKYLTRRGLIAASIPPERDDGGILPWVSRVSTCTGLRWAHDTVCKTVKTIVSLAPPDGMGIWLAADANFWTLSDDVALDWFVDAVKAHEATTR